jgi:2-hydroxychromene-2-carboxylate isomerase
MSNACPVTLTSLDEFAPVFALATVSGGVGELIVLAERLADRSRPASSGEVAFFFDLTCPFSYLTAERIERVLGHVDWIPTAAPNLHDDGHWSRAAAARHDAECQAAAFKLPLVWPDHPRAEAQSAMRAASYAVEAGAGAQFALAASRLAFCGGFDLADPEILAEAAAAASIPLRECLEAAGDVSRDGALHATGRGLRSRGVRRLPAIRVERSWFYGDGAMAGATAALRTRQALDSPLAPAG